MKVSSKILAVIVLLAAFYGSFSFVSSIIDREPPIIYEAAKAMAPSVQSGGTIDVEFKVFRKRICDQVVKRYLTDATGTKHSIPSYTVGVQMLAGRETYQRSITVPSAAVVGPASYQVIIDYACNALQRISGFPIEVASPPITFDIVPAVDDPKVEPVGPDG